MNKKNKVNVVVTGFGPFKHHTVNASWQTVCLLPELFSSPPVNDIPFNELDERINLIICELPVVYDQVDRMVPQLWKLHQPELMIHVGVSSIATSLTLEQVAHCDGYKQIDAEGCMPPSDSFKQRGADVKDEVTEVNDLVADLSMSEVRRAVINAIDIGVDAAVSMDPGRYLCDYVYYTSLQHDKTRCAFIHVPPANQPYSVSHLARSIRVAILDMLRQLKI